jgi:AcrR family transcriptional regulator
LKRVLILGVTTPVRSSATARREAAKSGGARRRVASGESGSASDGAAPFPLAAPPPIAGLAASQVKRMRRIVDAAVRLAEGGGFEAVRLRDVAEASDVALGTLYKYFHSKEDILLFALNEEVGRLEAAIVTRPITGGEALERVETLFVRATSGLTRRPHFARAVLRSIAGGDLGMSLKVAGFMLRMTRLVVAAERGEAPNVAEPVDAPYGTEREGQIAIVLINFWFSSLSGWAGGLHSAREVAEQVRTAAALLMGGD